MTVTRLSVKNERLVYAILVAKPFRYPHGGRSRVAYFGTTEKGITRMASSAAHRAQVLLTYHGVKEFEVRVLTCAPRRGVKSWRKLERALLLSFREIYGTVPRLNTQGKGISETDEFEYFSRARIRQVVTDLAK